MDDLESRIQELMEKYKQIQWCVQFVESGKARSGYTTGEINLEQYRQLMYIYNNASNERDKIYKEISELQLQRENIYKKKKRKKEKQIRKTLLCVVVSAFVCIATICIVAILHYHIPNAILDQEQDMKIVGSIQDNNSSKNKDAYEYTHETNRNGLDKAQQESHKRVVANRIREAKEYASKNGMEVKEKATSPYNLITSDSSVDKKNLTLKYKDYEAMLKQAGFTPGANDWVEEEKPYSGKVLYYDVSYDTCDISMITVTAPSEEDIVVTLRSTITDKTVVAFYVQAGETTTVKIPAINYYTYVTGGKNWCGYQHGFKISVWHGSDNEILNCSNKEVEYIISNEEDYWTRK